jgi:hypothetical protein
MDDLSNFLEFLYEAVDGYVYVATKDTLATNQTWVQEFFDWPAQKQEIHDYISLQQEKMDVYVAPCLYKNKRGLKSAVKGTNVVWVEFDGQQQIDYDGIPEPDCVVQTSNEHHLHCYWKVDYSEDADLIEGINRRLMYHLEADMSGIDISQVLRPPLSKNWKHKGLPVTLKRLHIGDKRDLSEFDGAPEVKQEIVRLNSEMLLDPQTLLKDLPLHAKLKRKIISEEVSNTTDRSGFLMKIGYELAEEGCNHIQIVSLLDYADNRIGKFSGRRDKLQRLSEIASRAILQCAVEEELTLYSPWDILNYKEDLEWIIESWIHRTGFGIMTGSPGVGKTSLCLQLMYLLATGEDIFGRKIAEPQKVLFISLEMTVLELKYFYDHHKGVFGSNPLWNTNIRILDQNATLLDYEEKIAEFEPSIVFIDSLTELASEELKEAEARAITRWIKKCRRKYHTAFICIHHNRKESGLKFKEVKLRDVYGSFIFAKDVDTVWNLDRDPDEEDRMSLYTLKSRYAAKSEIELHQNKETLLYESGKQVSNDSEGAVTIGNGTISIDLS